MFLHSQLLPIDEFRVRVQELPLNSVAAFIILASSWLSEFEMLIHIGVDGVAFQALESSLEKLWLDFSGASDCAVYGHQPTES